MIAILAAYLLTINPPAPDATWLDDMRPPAVVRIVADKRKITLEVDNADQHQE